jgi:hypothetical protein
MAAADASSDRSRTPDENDGESLGESRDGLGGATARRGGGKVLRTEVSATVSESNGATVSAELVLAAAAASPPPVAPANADGNS